MTPQTVTNPYAMSARQKKAQALADLLFDNEFPAKDIEHITEEQWEAVAKQAGCQPPHSQETVDLVIEIVAKRENNKAAIARKVDRLFNSEDGDSASRVSPLERQIYGGAR